MGDRLSDLGLLAVGVLGTLFGLVHIQHLLVLDRFRLRLLEAALPLALAVGLIAGAGWLSRQRFTRRETGRLLAWVLAGSLAAVATMSWTLGHELLATGSVRHVRFLTANNATAGAVTGLVLGVYDVRSARRAEAHETASRRLQRERNRFATLFENVPSPTVYYELDEGDPVILEANPAFGSTFGHDPDAVVGESVDDLIVPPDHDAEADRLNDRVVKEDLQVEVTRSTTAGRGDFLLYTVPLAGEENRGFATYVDLTEQKRREQRLNVLNRVLRHDLRNAMNVVVGHADTLVAGEETPETAAAAIRGRAEELLDKSRKARTVERILDDDSALDGRVDLTDVLADRVERARDRHPELTVEESLPDGPVWTGTDDLLGVAVDNLLENVAAHGGEDPHACVSLDPGSPHTVRLTDDGPGIPEAEVNVLTRQRETQLEHTSGLGLWLVVWIVHDVGGEVSIRNDEDGTEVTVLLPATDPPDDDANR